MRSAQTIQPADFLKNLNSPTGPQIFSYQQNKLRVSCFEIFLFDRNWNLVGRWLTIEILTCDKGHVIFVLHKAAVITSLLMVNKIHCDTLIFKGKKWGDYSNGLLGRASLVSLNVLFFFLFESEDQTLLSFVMFLLISQFVIIFPRYC